MRVGIRGKNGRTWTSGKEAGRKKDSYSPEKEWNRWKTDGRRGEERRGKKESAT